MKILFAGGESVPYCKTGGLADVMGALPAALTALGHSTVRFLPLYKDIEVDRFQIEDTGHRFTVPIRNERHIGEIWASRQDENSPTYFLKFDPYFDRPGLYGPLPNSAYSDNDERYAFYCRGVLEAAKALNFKPDIVHGHDWQAGLLPAYLKVHYLIDPHFAKTASVFTIHNMAYQGLFPKEALVAAGFSWKEFTLQGLEFYDKINYLKAGLIYSDALNTVSPTYAGEIMTDPHFGFGLEGVLTNRTEQFRGIVNGIDQKAWDPGTDTFIKKNFDAKHLSGRVACRADLLKRVELRLKKDSVVVSFIGRLDYHKGVDVLLALSDVLMKENIGFIFLGNGHPDYQRALWELKAKYPGRIAVENRFAEDLAHKMYAGSDLMLMPSRFEPCGLTQLISMRYGTMPVVSPTGGLVDTVLPLSKDGKRGSGFVAADMSSEAFYGAIRGALNFFKKRRAWAATMARVMKIDHSWTSSAGEYERLYKDALRWKKGNQ